MISFQLVNLGASGCVCVGVGVCVGGGGVCCATVCEDVLRQWEKFEAESLADHDT